MNDVKPNLRRIGIGLVAENKLPDSHRIEVFPVELLNIHDGDVSSLTKTLTSKGAGAKVEITVGSTIEAEWLGETNRITSPDVRRNEQVDLFQQGDSDIFYWASTGRDDSLRRLETVIYRFSGLPDNADEAITADNSYYLEISTHKRIVTFKTSARNGELVKYMVQANPGMGQFTVQDDYGNLMQIDSAKGVLHLRNEAGSLVEINKKRVHIQADWSVSLKTERAQIKCDEFRLEADDVEFQTKRFHVSGAFSAGSIQSSDIKASNLQSSKYNYPKPKGGASAKSVPSDITTEVKYPFSEG